MKPPDFQRAPRELLLGRRDVVMLSAMAACATALRPATALAEAGPASGGGALTDVTFKVNGEKKTLRIEPRVTLLDALRENLHLTGTKKGCDMGQCGACTVLLDGERIDSCLTLALQAEGREVTTIEGLSHGDALHPMQQAFLDCDAFQCGYCTPGQILSAVALHRERPPQSDDEIRERMSGNICRCGAYPNIVAAVRQGRV